MFKFTAIVVLALAVCATADPIRQRPLGRRQSARQQLQPTPAPTGYPAAGVTPETPFDLPTETEQPEVVFTDDVTPQPDEVYGPPELDAQQPNEPEISPVNPDEVYGPPEVEAQPDEVYGPPATVFSNPEIIETVPEIIEIEQEGEHAAEDLDEVDGELIVDENGAVISVSSTFEQKPARLIYQRFPQSRQAPKAVPARLTKAKYVQPAKLVYTARFQNLQRFH